LEPRIPRILFARNQLIFLTFTAGPEMVSRIFSAKDEKASRNALIWAAVFMGVFSFIPTFIGLAGYAINPNMPSNQVLAQVIFGHTPAWVAGIVSAAIIASTMSSADSDMLCASTIFTKDLLPYFKKVSLIKHKSSSRGLAM